MLKRPLREFVVTDVLFDEWQAYSKVVENDYMGHARFFRRIEEEIATRFSRPVEILDLGCGDAVPMRGLLERLSVGRYCGVDDSAEALARAGVHLESLAIPYELHRGDLFETLRAWHESVDVIVASYSIHHVVGSAMKARLLAACRRLLKPGGLLLVVDVFLNEGETRSRYLERWERNARESFRSLNDQEMELLIRHIRDNDYPESFSTYEELGARAGYRGVVRLVEDELNKLVLLQP